MILQKIVCGLKRKNGSAGRLGFTLIEILMVTSLMAVLGLAIYRSVINGLKIWERNSLDSNAEDVAIFLDKIAYDLRNTLRHSSVPMFGNATAVSFSTMVRTLEDERKRATISVITYIDQIGRVEYYYDEVRGSLMRRQANYSQALDRTFGEGRELVKSIRGLQFSYFLPGDGGPQGRETIQGEVPYAVKVSVTFLERTGGVRTMERLILIPIRFI